MENSINKKGYKSKWTTIDSGDNHKIQGERKYLRINPSIGKESTNFSSLNMYYDTIQHAVCLVPNFDKAVLKKFSRMILRNDGNVSEQYVHRDEPIEEKDYVDEKEKK